MADVSPPKDSTSASPDVPSPDTPRKLKRKPSKPVDPEDPAAPAAARTDDEHGNGHASNGDGPGTDPQRDTAAVQGPGAGTHDSPVDPSLPPESDKPTDTTSTNASNPNKASRKPPRSSSPRQKKPSFWTRLIHSLVPCVGPSHAHTTDVDDASPLREKQRSPDLEKTDVDDRTLEKKDKAQEASTSSGHTAEPSAQTLTAPLTIPSQPLLPPSPTTDPAVIVPPSPKSHRLPREETEGVTSGAVQPPGSTGTEEPDPDAHAEEQSDRSDSSSFTDDEEHERVLSAGAGSGVHEEDLEDDEDRLISNGGAGIPVGPDGVPRPLLPPVAAHHTGRKCLVLDLDETLVHSSFKLIPQADYVVPVEIEWQWHNVYVIKRPGVDNFLKQMGELYEIVVFTASLSKYADPVLDKLDVHKVVSHRLFRESCYNHRGNYVKDLSQLGRPITDTIILDNSPASYIFHPNNAVPVSSWFNDPHDTELTDLCPFLTDLGTVDDVRGVLDGGL